MFAKLQLELKTAECDMLHWQKAVLLQSVLMEQISQEYAKELHKSQLHTYRQSVEHQNGKNIWTVCTFNEEAYQQVILPLQSSQFKEFEIAHNGWKLSVGKKELVQMDVGEFMEQYYFTAAERYLKIQFQTPAAFKRQGNYVFFPELQLIYQSLMNKYDAASKEETVASQEALQELVQSSQIAGYRLRSCSYSVHGSKVPAFFGEIKIRINAPQALVNFANMLFHFGEYSGIGIKTAMGMGSIKVLGGDYDNRENAVNCRRTAP